jgi:hypothetical protein
VKLGEIVGSRWLIIDKELSVEAWENWGRLGRKSFTTRMLEICCEFEDFLATMLQDSSANKLGENFRVAGFIVVGFCCLVS